MADYFTNFSLVLELPSEAARHYALDLAHQASLMMHGDEDPENIPDCLTGVLDGWSFETEAQESRDGWGLWMHSSYGGIDAVCAFIQHLLQKFDPHGCVSFQWSDDCSKPRIDAYGGGAAIITANKIRSIHTGQWIQQQIKRFPVRTNNQPTKGKHHYGSNATTADAGQTASQSHPPLRGTSGETPGR